MKNIFITFALTWMFVVNGQSKASEEIRLIEKKFEDELNEKGAAYAFEKYATEDAVIKRENDTLIIGRAAIKNYYDRESYRSAKAYWSPDRIEVSADGTMASTFGKYRWITTDKNGKTTEYKGVFHTVWKRQKDGSWRYIWD